MPAYEQSSRAIIVPLGDYALLLVTRILALPLRLLPYPFWILTLAAFTHDPRLHNTRRDNDNHPGSGDFRDNDDSHDCRFHPDHHHERQ